MGHKNFLLSAVKSSPHTIGGNYAAYKQIIEIALNHLDHDSLKKINEKYNLIDEAPNYEIAMILADKGLKPSKHSAALITAAKLGDIEFIKLLIDNGVDINGATSKNAIAAILSALNSSSIIIVYHNTLLEKKPERDKKLTQAFKYFVDKGVSLDFIVEKNPNNNSIRFTDECIGIEHLARPFYTLLDYAPNSEITKILIKKGIVISDFWRTMDTALYQANYALFKYAMDLNTDFKFEGDTSKRCVQFAVDLFRRFNKSSDRCIKDFHKIVYEIIERGGAAYINNYDNINYESALWLERAIELTKIFNKETNLADDKDSVIPIEQIKEYLFLLKNPKEVMELTEYFTACNIDNQNIKNITEQLYDAQSLQFISCLFIINEYKNNISEINNLPLTECMKDYCIDLSKFLPEILNFAMLGEAN